MTMSCFRAAGYSAAVNQATKPPWSCATSTHLHHVRAHAHSKLHLLRPTTCDIGLRSHAATYELKDAMISLSTKLGNAAPIIDMSRAAVHRQTATPQAGDHSRMRHTSLFSIFKGICTYLIVFLDLLELRAPAEP